MALLRKPSGFTCLINRVMPSVRALRARARAASEGPGSVTAATDLASGQFSLGRGQLQRISTERVAALDATRAGLAAQDAGGEHRLRRICRPRDSGPRPPDRRRRRRRLTDLVDWPARWTLPPRLPSVDGLRGFGYPWAEIASRLGTSRQAAQQRWAGIATPVTRSRVSRAGTSSVARLLLTWGSPAQPLPAT